MFITSLATGKDVRNVSKIITILGDSIARGLMYDDATNKYTICRDTFMNALSKKGYNLKNLARVGGTIDNATELFEKCEKQPGTMLAVEVGGNDSALKWDEVAANPDAYHDAVVPLKDFGEKLRSLLNKAKTCSMQPLLVTPLPVVADRYIKWMAKDLDFEAIMRYLGSYEWIYRWQERYALEALKAARDVECRIFDLRSEFLLQRDFPSLMCEDGIHPNKDGYQLISKAVMAMA